MKIKTVLFDFDGTIIDSLDVKTQAFAEMFKPYGAEVEAAVVEYHLAHGGVSRFEKFRYYYRELLGKPIDDGELEALGREFVRLTLDKVLAAPFIPGALESLELLLAKGIPAFIVSGIPEQEVVMVLERLDLTRFFREIHGSPRTKPVIVRDILARWGFEPASCLFVGDATTDYDAALACGLEFLGIVKVGSVSRFPPGTRVSPVLDIKGFA